MKDDTISRAAAIDALDKRFDSIPMEQTSEILMLRKDLRELPPANNSEIPNSSDTISRQAALTALKDWYDGMIISSFRGIEKVIDALPPAQPEPEEFEWCHTCREYDQEKHCCHRWTKVIRKTVDDMKAAQPGWIPCSVMLPENDGVYLVTLRAITQLQKACAKIDIARFDGKWHKAYPVVAWMPLPIPWEGGQDGEG